MYYFILIGDFIMSMIILDKEEYDDIIERIERLEENLTDDNDYEEEEESKEKVEL